MYHLHTCPRTPALVQTSALLMSMCCENLAWKLIPSQSKTLLSEAIECAASPGIAMFSSCWHGTWLNCKSPAKNLNVARVAACCLRHPCSVSKRASDFLSNHRPHLVSFLTLPLDVSALSADIALLMDVRQSSSLCDSRGDATPASAAALVGNCIWIVMRRSAFKMNYRQNAGTGPRGVK